jgi:hypothetical protein
MGADLVGALLVDVGEAGLDSASAARYMKSK